MMKAGSSKTKGSDAAEPVQVNGDALELQPPINTGEYAIDLRSHEAAPRLDPGLGTFDHMIGDWTSRVLNSPDTGVEVQTSASSFQEDIKFLLELDLEDLDVEKFLRESMEDICNNKELSLVKEYLENSIQTLEFCGAIEDCLERARKNRLIIQLAIQKFEEEVKDGGEERKFRKTLNELNKFKATEKPFDVEFRNRFLSVREQQDLLLKKLQQQMNTVNEKLKSAQTWRKLSNILCVGLYLFVAVSAVLAAAIKAPAAVTAVAAALVVPVGSLGKGCSWLWNRYENTLKGQRELLGPMRISTRYITINNMKTIGVLVIKMETKIESLLFDANFALGEQGAVKLVVEDIKERLKEFMETIEDLGKQAAKCSKEIERARRVILQKIKGPPSQSATIDCLWN